MHLTHAALAGRWQYALLKDTALAQPNTIEDANTTLYPTEEWLFALNSLKQQLTSYEEQNNQGQKLEQFTEFKQQLDNFYALTLRQSPAWNYHYLAALQQWQTAATDKLNTLQIEMQNLEPIAKNCYLAGSPLNPEKHRAIFFGRNDLRDTLANKILTAQELPLFLIRGQRRVGKTSLLRFLPSLLGSRFILIEQDLQNAKYTKVENWLNDIYQQFNQKLKLTADIWQPTSDWLQDWQFLENYLTQHSQNQQAKIIIALDEYEMLHKDILCHNPQLAARLLAAMRSFLQAQNRVVFLLIGAAFLDELQQPNWYEYFTNLQTLTVDYLNETDSKRLITEPVKLEYPPEIVDKLYQQTQGHPHLLQLLCQNLVSYANNGNRRHITPDDLAAAIDNATEYGTVPQNLFWHQFCAAENHKETVQQIVNKLPITDREALARLKLHNYIVRDANQQWQIRVPLFEQWLKRHELV